MFHSLSSSKKHSLSLEFLLKTFAFLINTCSQIKRSTMKRTNQNVTFIVSFTIEIQPKLLVSRFILQYRTDDILIPIHTHTMSLDKIDEFKLLFECKSVTRIVCFFERQINCARVALGNVHLHLLAFVLSLSSLALSLDNSENDYSFASSHISKRIN